MMYKDYSLYPTVTIVIAVFILEVNYWIPIGITSCKYVTVYHKYITVYHFLLVLNRGLQILISNIMGNPESMLMKQLVHTSDVVLCHSVSEVFLL